MNDAELLVKYPLPMVNEDWLKRIRTVEESIEAKDIPMTEEEILKEKSLEFSWGYRTAQGQPLYVKVTGREFSEEEGDQIIKLMQELMLMKPLSMFLTTEAHLHVKFLPKTNENLKLERFANYQSRCSSSFVKRKDSLLGQEITKRLRKCLGFFDSDPKNDWWPFLKKNDSNAWLSRILIPKTQLALDGIGY